LENPWIAAPPNFVIEKSLSYQGRRKWPPSFSKLFPNISLAVLSDFKGLERKNLGGPSSQASFLGSARLSPGQARLNISRETHYSRGRRKGERFHRLFFITY
jgi:hypothetical protein